MSARLSSGDIQEIFSRDIAPELQAQVDRARSEQRYVLVFVGGQPGAGKSRVVAMAAADHQGSVEINGDDLRKYHPAYDQLMETAPLKMPEVTAEASGRWVGMSAEYLRDQRTGVVLETTMRQVDVVSKTASEFKAAGYSIEARCLAVPAAVSRLGTVQRYAEQIRHAGAGRWTATTAHDAAVAAMPETVESLIDAGLINRALVQRRDGAVLFDRAYDPQRVSVGDGATVREQIEFGRAVSSMAEAEARDWVGKLTETSKYLGQERPTVGPDVQVGLVRLIHDAREVAAAGWPTDLERRAEALGEVAQACQWLAEHGARQESVSPHNPLWTQAGPEADSSGPAGFTR